MNLTTIGLASLLVLTACTTVAPPPVQLPAEVITKTKLVDTSCDWDTAITIDPLHDVLTSITAQEILAHNKSGAAHCGWKPNVKPVTPAK